MVRLDSLSSASACFLDLAIAIRVSISRPSSLSRNSSIDQSEYVDFGLPVAKAIWLISFLRVNPSADHGSGKSTFLLFLLFLLGFSAFLRAAIASTVPVIFLS